MSTAQALEAAPFSVEQFAAFWAKPDAALVSHAVAPDVVGYWPGEGEPARGSAAYAERIAQVLAVIPDLRLEVIEHATNGDLLFVRWRARGNGAKGPFALEGMDRIRTRDGRVVENVIMFDTAAFHSAIGRAVPYAPSQTPA